MFTKLGSVNLALGGVWSTKDVQPSSRLSRSFCEERMIASIFNFAFLLLLLGLLIWGGLAFAKAARERLTREEMLEQIRREDAEKEARFRRMAEAEVNEEATLEENQQ